MKDPLMMTSTELREAIKKLSDRIHFFKSIGKQDQVDKTQQRLDTLQEQREQLHE